MGFCSQATSALKQILSPCNRDRVAAEFQRVIGCRNWEYQKEQSADLAARWNHFWENMAVSMDTDHNGRMGHVAFDAVNHSPIHVHILRHTYAQRHTIAPHKNNTHSIYSPDCTMLLHLHTHTHTHTEGLRVHAVHKSFPVDYHLYYYHLELTRSKCKALSLGQHERRQNGRADAVTKVRCYIHILRTANAFHPSFATTDSRVLGLTNHIA